MLIPNSLLLIFAVAFMGCVLATPVVTRIAVWAGAIDRPDQFRRIHPALRNLTPAEMAGPGNTAPFHDGALRYYRERHWLEP